MKTTSTKSILSACLLAVLTLSAPAQAEIVDPSVGEQIYVPIYSSIFYNDSRKTVELAATMSVHNVDPDQPIILQSVDYYNTAGKLIRHYLDAPVELKPLETRNFVVDKSDTSGGTGANFLITWKSSTPVSSPVAEALMVSLSSGQSISFTSAGKVVRKATGN